MSDIKKNLGDLEKRIQNLITSHQELRDENKTLKKVQSHLEKKVEEEKQRVKRMEEGYNELMNTEKTKSSQSIARLQQRINDIISEIDKSASLIDSSK